MIWWKQAPVPRDVVYLEDIAGGLVRVRAAFTLDGGWVTKLLIQLEIYHNGQWKPARRYDDSHGQPHIDLLDESGREYRKIWLACTRNEVVTMALRDFGDNWEHYAAEFMER